MSCSCSETPERKIGERLASTSGELGVDERELGTDDDVVDEWRHGSLIGLL